MAEDDPQRAALEEMIERDPDQASNYLVLADHLQERGDPRGEMIARWSTANAMDRAQYQKALGPSLPGYSTVDWFYGFVRGFRLTCGEDDQAEVAAFLEHPSLRYARRATIEVRNGRHDDCQWALDLVTARVRTTWRAVEIRSVLRGGNEPPHGDLDLSALWPALPRVQKLAVTARHVTPGALTSATLEPLEIDGEVDSYALQPLIQMSMPARRELVLHDVVNEAELGRRLAVSALRKQLVTMEITAQDEDVDRYEQTGE
jgi:uncharacterized protein (TIGR02996 family)